jgi:predicted rRNA methylase YqxC with S4 and FtsJ domains
MDGRIPLILDGGDSEVGLESTVISLVGEKPCILRPGGIYVGLIKPQFECGRSALDRHGIVKSRSHHKAAITRVVDCAALCGLVPRAVIPSPITGGDGNREFLMWCVKTETNEENPIANLDIERIVRL